MSVVVCKLPKAGLGNYLFPLMNAYIFATLNDIPVIVTGYHHFKVGPYLRKEKIKRKYKGYFKFQKSIIGECFDQLKIYRLKKKWAHVHEPPVQKMNKDALADKVFIFKSLPTYHDYFKHLKDHRQHVKSILPSILNSWILAEVNRADQPVIGVHIRMGDFRKLKEGEDFSKVGHVRTPEIYFIECINAIRKVSGSSLPVSVFTDGYKHEFEQLFALDNITMIEGNADIVDLLLLSMSKILVAANGSTFSYWAGFLADAPLIKHQDHLYAPFRPGEVNQKFYEGPLIENKMSGLLENNIKAISIDLKDNE